MRVDIFFHTESDRDFQAEVLRLLRNIQQGEQIIMADLTNLTTQVKNTTDVEQSAIVLLKGLADQIAQLKTDPAALQALADQLKSKSDELAAAVTANTPAA